jgi:signal peptidase II
LQRKYLFTAILAAVIVLLDILTKRWALGALSHGYTVQALDGWLPLTLAFNRGIAFGIGVPEAGRWLLVLASVAIIVVLFRLLQQASPRDGWRILAIGLVQAGAIGNLIDRVRWDRGVVDFIGPIDLGFMYWPIFNVADMAITVGAVALGLSLWRSEAAAEQEERAAAAALAND